MSSLWAADGLHDPDIAAMNGGQSTDHEYCKKKLPWYVLDLESYACNHYEMISILFLLMIPIPCQAHRWWELHVRKLSTSQLLSWCINDP